MPNVDATVDALRTIWLFAIVWFTNCAEIFNEEPVRLTLAIFLCGSIL